jgi:hypothetical protein
VPGKRVAMRKAREVLRLHFDLHLGQRQIARSANISQSTVHDYLERFTAAGLSWPLPAEMAEASWKQFCFLPLWARAAKNGFRPSATRLRPHSRRAATAQAHHPAIALGGVPRRASRWLRIQPALHRGDQSRTSPRFAPDALGLAAFAHDRLGPHGGSAYRRGGRKNPGSVLASRNGYRSCLGIIRLGHRYPSTRMKLPRNALWRPAPSATAGAKTACIVSRVS